MNVNINNPIERPAEALQPMPSQTQANQKAQQTQANQRTQQAGGVRQDEQNPQMPNAHSIYQSYAQATPATSLREEDITDSMLDSAFEGANRALSGGSFRLSHQLHEDSGRVIVRVQDSITNEVIREVPPESRLDMYVRITEFIGLLFDQGS